MYLRFFPNLLRGLLLVKWLTYFSSNSILSDKSTRRLFYFLIINLGFAFVENVYGHWTNSLGLISDSWHMFFDCTGLFVGLIAAEVTKWKPNHQYTYGYVRGEALAGFSISLGLVFIALNLFREAIQRTIEPPDVEHERLLVVSICGLLVNLIGIFVFDHGHAHGHGHSHGGHSHSHSHSHNYDSEPGAKNQIMQGVYLHILADALGSVGVIVSGALIYQFNWMIADPICSLFISFVILNSVRALLVDSFGVLMQRTPPSLEPHIPQCLQRVCQIPDVFSVQDPHFWTICSNRFAGSIRLEVSPSADLRPIISHTQAIFAQVSLLIS
ncbi:SLC30A7 [Cordylochernes scorpioides]|uniref:SLC30A7 n=1 Tax=Cordylochernes scorpioides TaxID=51811 RepID=A0ABY6LYB0_9ARAC|nr:SLC30A7 [Cordylochernes scorpioides]